jgi:hypothetical protein
MTMSDTHQTIANRLSDYIDDELDARERAGVDEHLATCADCRTVLADLRVIVEGARQLPPARPENELWDGIESRLDAREATALPFAPTRRRTFSFTLPQLAAAGIALMVMSGGLVYMAGEGGRTPPASEVAAQDSAGAFSPASLVDPRYEDAVHDLERTLAEGRGRLDPDTVRVLEQNLATIDRAIAQSREALESDPGNIFLNSHLVSARQRKLALLRRATALTTGS